MKKTITIDGDTGMLVFSVVHHDITYTKHVDIGSMTCEEITQATQEFMTQPLGHRGSVPGSDRCKHCRHESECN